MLLYKQKKNQPSKGNRFLISVTVLGSAGPIRFVVNEDELVAAVIDTALKSFLPGQLFLKFTFMNNVNLSGLLLNKIDLLAKFIFTSAASH
ncbi:UNVERIFIED_CONTAM: hypothetical protein Scaly_0954000 [Sesamum calycinum]|uniref:DUF7054 domain-containing protein n=1 Tax=Sesamum calycinum TaxID=2727403 RepID=A0AAW2QYL7_9LAMI